MEFTLRHCLSLLLAVSLLGCGDTTDDTDSVSLEGIPSGAFVMGISLAPAGGLVVPFQIEATPGYMEDGSRGFSEIVVYATKASDWSLSETLQTFQNVPISDEGSFELAFNIVMPGPYSPTLSEVEITSTIDAQFGSDQFFCGSVDGEIPTFDMDLSGSTFGAVPWQDKDQGVAASCDDDPTATLPRITAEDCPSVVEGGNTGFPSAGLDREFVLQLPPDYEAGKAYPLVFAWHGFGGTAAGFLDGALSAAGRAADVILVAPQGTDKGGSTSFDPFGEERRNYDVALFDDILTCVSDQMMVDLNRVYVTGMSNGGLMSGALLARRAATFAAAAPLSGGISVAFAEDHEPIPSLVVWGGEEDFAFEQNFHTLATSMIDALLDRGHFLATCNHNTGHEIPPGAWSWVFEFLLAHDKATGNTSPFESGLTEGFPAYCTIAE